MMYEEDIEEGKGFHLHVGAGRLVTEVDKDNRGGGEMGGDQEGQKEALPMNIAYIA